MKLIIFTFFACIQMAFANFENPCVVGEVEWKESSGITQIIAKPGAVIECDRFTLDEGEQLEILSAEVTIKSREAMDIAGTVTSNGNLTLDGSLTLKGELSSREGTIRLLGDSIAIEGGINVSSKRNGGKVDIGSNAKEVYIGRNAWIYADSLEEGSGGEVMIWSDESTTFLGTISACAKGNGRGGIVDVSGKRGYIFDGDVFHCGEGGKLLLDPKFAYITRDGLDLANGNTFASDPGGTVYISGSSLETALNGGDVTIQATTDIIFDDIVTVTTSGSALSLEAGRSVIFYSLSALTLNNAPFYVQINDAGALSDRDDGPAQFQIFGQATINTQGGNITVEPGTYDGTQVGRISMNGVAIDAGGGNIFLQGIAPANSSKGTGIAINGTSVFATSGSGTITLDGQGGAQSSYSHGIQLTGFHGLPTTLTTEDGAILLTGTGGGNASGQMNVGVSLSEALIETTGSGTIDLVGTAGAGIKYGVGILLSSSGTTIAAKDGDITVTGIGTGTGTANSGIRLELGSAVVSTGAATITLDGTSGNGTNCNSGVIFSTYPTVIKSVSGDVLITGVAKGSGFLNQGIRLESGALIRSTDSATIILNGTGSPGTHDDNGVAVIGSSTTVTNVNGDIDITGVATTSDQPILIQYPKNVYTTGTGKVDLNP